MTKITFQQPVTWPKWAQLHKHKIRYPKVRPSYAKALYLIERYADKLGISELIITTNHHLTPEGSLGHNNQGPAVAVYFIYKDEKYVIAQDIFFDHSIFCSPSCSGAWLDRKINPVQKVASMQGAFI